MTEHALPFSLPDNPQGVHPAQLRAVLRSIIAHFASLAHVPDVLLPADTVDAMIREWLGDNQPDHRLARNFAIIIDRFLRTLCSRYLDVAYQERSTYVAEDLPPTAIEHDRSEIMNGTLPLDRAWQVFSMSLDNMNAVYARRNPLGLPPRGIEFGLSQESQSNLLRTLLAQGVANFLNERIGEVSGRAAFMDKLKAEGVEARTRLLADIRSRIAQDEKHYAAQLEAVADATAQAAAEAAAAVRNAKDRAQHEAAQTYHRHRERQQHILDQIRSLHEQQLAPHEIQRLLDEYEQQLRQHDEEIAKLLPANTAGELEGPP